MHHCDPGGNLGPNSLHGGAQDGAEACGSLPASLHFRQSSFHGKAARLQLQEGQAACCCQEARGASPAVVGLDIPWTEALCLPAQSSLRAPEDSFPCSPPPLLVVLLPPDMAEGFTPDAVGAAGGLAVPLAAASSG